MRAALRAWLVCFPLLAGCTATPTEPNAPASPPDAPPETREAPAAKGAQRPPAGLPPEGTVTLNAVKIYEVVAQYPPPIWGTDVDTVTTSHFNRQQKGNQFILEQVPGDEELSSWQHIYSIYGLYAKNIRFEAFKTRSLERWVRTCGHENLAVQNLIDEPLHWMAIVVCESAPAGSSESGWSDSVGAVTLMDSQRLSDTYVRVHHTWRGPRFSRGDLATWPVSEADMKEMIRRLARVHLTYNPDAAQTPHPGRDFEPRR
jgi:hypothetical protein